MVSHLIVDNIKCSGCAATITKKLTAIPNISDIKVDVSNGKISFHSIDHTIENKVIEVLKKFGYPLSGTGTTLDGAKSIVSCMIGRIDKSKW